MNIGNLAVTSMKNEKKKYSFLIVNLTFAVAVSIIFSHFVCIIVVAVALVFYANESYLQNQKKPLVLWRCQAQIWYQSPNTLRYSTSSVCCLR